MSHDRPQPSRRREPDAPGRGGRRGFTLIELLVVIVIVLLVSAVTLPTIVSAFSNRQVGEGARTLQAAFAGARDEAIRANAPRGFRLLPDPTISSLATNGRLAANRLIPIEPAPALIEGLVTFPTRNAEWTSGSPPVFPFPVNASIPTPSPNTNGSYPFPLDGVTPDPTQNIFGIPTSQHVLMVVEARFEDNRGLVPNPFTNWFWNVRIGDRMKIGDSGAIYTVVGPMTVYNPENYVNIGPAGTPPALLDRNYMADGTPINVQPEFLFLVNGVDDNGDGYPDQGLDGVDGNLNGLVDDYSEWVAPTGSGVFWTSEKEAWLSPALKSEWDHARNYPQAPNPPLVPPIAAQRPPATYSYTIYRRPVVSPGAREVNLPAGSVIDMTTWNTTRERSRLPVNPVNGTVDILLKPSGELLPAIEYSSPSSFPLANAFFHFWIADREDVIEPFNGDPTTASYPNLPVPEGTLGYTGTTFLKKDRQLLTFFTRTGQVVTNSVENFNLQNQNAPYNDAQLGIREAK